MQTTEIGFEIREVTYKLWS